MLRVRAGMQSREGDGPVLSRFKALDWAPREMDLISELRGWAQDQGNKGGVGGVGGWEPCPNCSVSYCRKYPDY